jgi:hypothetical protein
VGCEYGGWTALAHDRVQWWNLLLVMSNPCVLLPESYLVLNFMLNFRLMTLVNLPPNVLNDAYSVSYFCLRDAYRMCIA